jgi:DNA polymerase III delta subunit
MPRNPAPPKSGASTALSGPPSLEARVVLLTGPESGRKLAEVESLVRKAADESYADFDVETVGGGSMTAERVLSGVSTAPYGAGKRVLVLRDTQQMDAEEQKRLAAGLGTVPTSSLLVLHTGTPVMEDGKVRRQTVVAPELSNAVKKLGRIIDFALPRTDDLRAWLTAEARALGKTLAPDAVALLAQMPGEDLATARTELAKAAAYAGDAPAITGADVEATMTRGSDDVIFKLCDAVGMRRTPEALGHVATLFRGGQRAESVAPRTLVLLARQIRLLSQFRYLSERRLGGRGSAAVPPDVLALLPSDGAASILTNPRTAWMADRYLAQARNFSGQELADRVQRLMHADLTLKGIIPGGDDPRAVLQRVVVEICEKR